MFNVHGSLQKPCRSRAASSAGPRLLPLCRCLNRSASLLQFTEQYLMSHTRGSPHLLPWLMGHPHPNLPVSSMGLMTRILTRSTKQHRSSILNAPEAEPPEEVLVVGNLGGLRLWLKGTVFKVLRRTSDSCWCFLPTNNSIPFK